MDEVKSAYDLAAGVFGSNYKESGGRKRHMLRVDRLNRPQDVVVIKKDEAVIGMVQIVERENYIL